MSKAKMAERHVLFMAKKEDRATYVGEMLRRMGVASSAGTLPAPFNFGDAQT